MKVGDKLYCYNNDDDFNFTIGNFYYVKMTRLFTDEILFVSDDKKSPIFLGSELKRRFFKTEQEIRKEKLFAIENYEQNTIY